MNSIHRTKDLSQCNLLHLPKDIFWISLTEETADRYIRCIAALKRAEKEANDERPFACSHPGCDRRFRQKIHMNRHIRIHTKEQPFVCNVCTRTFSQISSLERHMRVIHTALMN